MITQQYLKARLNYEPSTGVWTWLPENDNRMNGSWNTRYAGKTVGYIAGNGYPMVSIDDQRHYLHRLAFLYMTGSIPNVVDHIDRDPTNGRWVNLRACSQSANVANGKPRKNATGYSGVYATPKGRFQARYTQDYDRGYVGTFDTAEEAARARDAAMVERFGPTVTLNFPLQ